MKTITFNDKDYSVRDHLDMTGADWAQLGEAFEALTRVKVGETYREKMLDIVALIAPEALTDASLWTGRTLPMFFLALGTHIAKEPEKLAQVMRQADRAVSHLKDKKFQRGVFAEFGE